MFKRVLPYLFIFLFVWYLPELFLASNNLSSYIFREGTVRVNNKVDVKIVEKVSYFPEKYSVLNRGVRDIRIELVGKSIIFSRSVEVSDDGLAHFEGIPYGEYYINAGKLQQELFPDDVRKIESSGESIFYNQPTLPLSISVSNIKGDAFIVSIVRNKI